MPLGIIGAVILTFLGMVLFKNPNLSNNIYFQVAMIAVIGLSAKNAILIVEFAKELQEKGEELLEATLHASKMRLRPIIMTTLAFGFGVSCHWHLQAVQVQVANTQSVMVYWAVSFPQHF